MSTAHAWLGFYAVYSACCVALPLSCLQRLLGMALMLFTALAVWHCPCSVYSTCLAWLLCCLQRLLCGIAPILFTAIAWFRSYGVYSACCVALPLSALSCLQRLLGMALMLFTALAVWHCPYPVYGACLVWVLCCLQRLLCGIAPVLFTALTWLGCYAAVWHCPYPPYPVYTACCVALPLSCLQRLLGSACCVALPLSALSCLQRLLCGIAPYPNLFTALAWLGSHAV